MFFVYSYALAFWYGVKLIMDDRAYCIEDIKQCHIRYDPSSLLIGKKIIILKSPKIAGAVHLLVLDRLLLPTKLIIFTSLSLVFFSVLMGAMNVGQAMPYVEAFSMAKASAATIFR